MENNHKTNECEGMFMKSVNKLPIGVEIMLTMIVSGALNSNVSAAETKNEDSAKQEVAQSEKGEGFINEDLARDKNEEEFTNQKVTEAKTENEGISKVQVSEAERQQEGLSRLSEISEKKVLGNPKGDDNSKAVLSDVSKEAQVVTAEEEKIEDKKQDAKITTSLTSAKENTKSGTVGAQEINKGRNYNVEFTYDELQYILKGAQA